MNWNEIKDILLKSSIHFVILTLLIVIITVPSFQHIGVILISIIVGLRIILSILSSITFLSMLNVCKYYHDFSKSIVIRYTVFEYFKFERFFIITEVIVSTLTGNTFLVILMFIHYVCCDIGMYLAEKIKEVST